MEGGKSTQPNMGTEWLLMNRSWIQRLTLAAALLGILLLRPIAARADEQDDARDANASLAEHGWVVDSLHIEGTDRPGLRHLIAKGRLRLPGEAIWKAMANEKDRDWPGLNNIVREYENGDTLISRYELGVPVYADRTYRLRVINDHANRTMHFDQIHGYGNVREIRGYWSVDEASDTLSSVTYCVYTDPGVKWIPGFIVNWVTKREIPHLFSHLYVASKTYVGKAGDQRHTPGDRTTNITTVDKR
jgi:hypothetical protein